MKRILLTILATVLLLNFAACGSSDTDIAVDQINWSVAEGDWGGERYLMLQYTNDSDYTITSLRINFVGKEDITQKELDLFYHALQTSQASEGTVIDEFVQSRKQSDLPITMYAQADTPVEAGKTVQDIKCYFFGGYSSKDMICENLFAPASMTITYEKDGQTYTLHYDYETEQYTEVQKEKSV